MINIGHHLTPKFKSSNTKINEKTCRAWAEVLPGLKLFAVFDYSAKSHLSCNPTSSFDRNYVEDKAIVFLIHCFFFRQKYSVTKLIGARRKKGCTKINFFYVSLSEDEEGITILIQWFAFSCILYLVFSWRRNK